MGIFDFLKSNNEESKYQKERFKYQKELEAKRKKIKFSNLDEVSTIITPNIKNNVIWKDLRGKTVSKIPITYRDLSHTKFDNNKHKIWFYLGLKKFKNSERWVPVRKEEVDDKLNDINFINIHSVKSKEEILKERRLKEQQRIEKLNKSRSNILKELDWDGNGEVDVIAGNDFNLLLKKHQKSIIEIDRSYVQQFVQVSSYLQNKKNDIQLIFNSIKDTSNEEELNEYVGILKNEVHSYKLILFNSLNMIVSLVENDVITFYKIHGSFDKLNMFNSNWENELSEKLSNIGNELRNIGEGLSNLMYSINEMSENIVSEIGGLSYVTEESNRMLSNQLQDIDSSLQTNNLLTSIQTYQMYKINKNTKGLIE